MANSAFEIAVEAYISEHGSIDRETMDTLRTLYETGISKSTQASASFKRGYNLTAINDETSKIKLNQNFFNSINSSLNTLIEDISELKVKMSGREAYHNNTGDALISTVKIKKGVDSAVEKFKTHLSGLIEACNNGKKAGSNLGKD